MNEYIEEGNEKIEELFKMNAALTNITLGGNSLLNDLFELLESVSEMEYIIHTEELTLLNTFRRVRYYKK
jgi:hypothetical protein